LASGKLYIVTGINGHVWTYNDADTFHATSGWLKILKRSKVQNPDNEPGNLDYEVVGMHPECNVEGVEVVDLVGAN
jgi:hypothetical protein